MKEKRVLKVLFTKGGSGGANTRLALPVPWARELGVTEEEREVEVEIDGDKIIIKKFQNI